MKTQITKLSVLSLMAASVFTFSCKEDEKVSPGDANIISFSIDGVSGTINETEKTVSLELPAGEDVTQLQPTIILSQGATVSPASGASVDFTAPVEYTVTDVSGTVTVDYTVTVSSAALRKIAFLGVASENTSAAWSALAGSDFDLKDDETAAAWFAENMPSATREVAYHSFEDVANGNADLSAYNAIWIQYDGGWWGGEVAQFPNNANHCIIRESGIGFDTPCAQLAADFVTAIKTYYEAGGNIFLGNYAGSIVDEIGAVSAPEYAPNNSFGGIGVDEGATSGAWGVRWAGATSSPLFNNIVTATDAGCAAPFFILLEAGTLKKNRSNQYNLNFGPWAPNGDTDPLEDRKASFLGLTGATILMENCGENESLMLEWPATGSKGKVITVLSGTYDWYVGGVSNNENIPTLTENILDYLADSDL